MGGQGRAENTVDPSKYKANDLVVYNNSKNMGIILSVERDCLRILDSYSEVRSIRLQEVNSKKDTEYSLILPS